MNEIEIYDLLERKFQKYNKPDFIEFDPIVIPHRFTKKQDIEISGFFAAVLAWGQRKTIIYKCEQLMHMMGNSPHDFVINHTDHDLKHLLDFKHRTFNSTDLLYFIHFLKNHYNKFDSLEDAFLIGNDINTNIKTNLINFRNYFIEDDDFPKRTQKHISTPANNSACKRINMFLRWMVRKDPNGVDLGIWKTIKTHQLVCPCDVHVEKSAKKLGLTTRPKSDWLMAEEITNALSKFDSIDPVKYDFALFGMGLENYFE